MTEEERQDLLDELLYRACYGDEQCYINEGRYVPYINMINGLIELGANLYRKKGDKLIFHYFFQMMIPDSSYNDMLNIIKEVDINLCDEYGNSPLCLALMGYDHSLASDDKVVYAYNMHDPFTGEIVNTGRDIIYDCTKKANTLDLLYLGSFPPTNDRIYHYDYLKCKKILQEYMEKK